jgi:uncharacterized protein involved in tolerance to divalent cations
MASCRCMKAALAILLLCPCLSQGTAVRATESPGIPKVTVYPLVKEGYEDLEKGNYLEAVETLCRAVILDRDDVNARRYLAIALIKADDATRALEQLGLVGRLTPPTPFDFYIYGEAYIALGKYKEAEESFRKSLEKDQDFDAACAGVIKSLVGQVEWDEAIAECQKYLKQAKTKDQKTYYQSILKKLKEGKGSGPSVPEAETVSPPQETPQAQPQSDQAPNPLSPGQAVPTQNYPSLALPQQYGPPVPPAANNPPKVGPPGPPAILIPQKAAPAPTQKPLPQFRVTPSPVKMMPGQSIGVP